MIDLITHERIVIHNEGTGGAHFMLPDDQLATVVDALSRNNISHWVDDDTISLDGEPAVAVVNLGRGVDMAAAQLVLDSI